MKRFSATLLTVLSLLVLFLIGTDWVLETTGILTLPFLGEVEWQGLRQLEPWWLRFGIGAAAFILPILALATMVMAARDNAIRAKTTDGGVISLSPRAVETTVRRGVKKNVPEVLKAAVTAQQGGSKAAKVRVDVAVSDSVPVPQAEKKVRAEAEKVLKQLFGVADTRRIRVVVYDVSGRRKGSSRTGTKPPAKRMRPQGKPSPDRLPATKKEPPAPAKESPSASRTT